MILVKAVIESHDMSTRIFVLTFFAYESAIAINSQFIEIAKLYSIEIFLQI